AIVYPAKSEATAKRTGEKPIPLAPLRRAKRIWWYRHLACTIRVVSRQPRVAPTPYTSDPPPEDFLTDTTLAALRADAATLFHAAVAAVNPSVLVAQHLVRRGEDVCVAIPGETLWTWPSPTLVIGAGKAAARMAAGCEQALGSEHVRGEVVVA